MTTTRLAVLVIVTMRGTRAVLVLFYGAGVSFDDALPVVASIRGTIRVLLAPLSVATLVGGHRLTTDTGLKCGFITTSTFAV